VPEKGSPLRELFSLNDDSILQVVMDSLATHGSWTGTIIVPRRKISSHPPSATFTSKQRTDNRGKLDSIQTSQERSKSFPGMGNWLDMLDTVYASTTTDNNVQPANAAVAISPAVSRFRRFLHSSLQTPPEIEIVKEAFPKQVISKQFVPKQTVPKHVISKQLSGLSTTISTRLLCADVQELLLPQLSFRKPWTASPPASPSNTNDAILDDNYNNYDDTDAAKLRARMRQNVTFTCSTVPVSYSDHLPASRSDQAYLPARQGPSYSSPCLSRLQRLPILPKHPRLSRLSRPSSEEDLRQTFGDVSRLLAARRMMQGPGRSDSSGLARREKPAPHYYHEIHACVIDHPFLPGVNAIVVVQHDVTVRIEMERRVAAMLEAEHSLLENIFPCHVLQHVTLSSVKSGVPQRMPCIDKPHTLATSHEQITVLFADVVGFTPLCRDLPATVVMAFLNDLFSRLDELTTAYGVYKVETIGDCYMVAGGLVTQDRAGMSTVIRTVDPLHAQKVLDFAKAMLVAARSVHLPLSNEHVRLRIGIHSGPATSGVVGSKMPRFCLFGSTVNTASRMESTAEPGTIHASEATQALLPLEPWRQMPLLDVKGMGAMRTFKLEVDAGCYN
jgi:class 3 adenylate cyclase